jgi:pimeloyl-ACP methyl ester carboxylesterase
MTWNSSSNSSSNNNNNDNNNNNNNNKGGGYGSIERPIKIVNYYHHDDDEDDNDEEDLVHSMGTDCKDKCCRRMLTRSKCHPRRCQQQQQQQHSNILATIGLLLVILLLLLQYINIGRSNHETLPFSSNPTNGNNIHDATTGDASSTSSSSSTNMGRLMYYPHQLVNHFDSNLLDNFISNSFSNIASTNSTRTTWIQPYFVSERHFAGPGHPIVVILGGEGPVSGILYPFVSEGLAAAFGAHVVQTEHRFYGNSQPVTSWEEVIDSSSSSSFLLSPEQALEDWIQIIRYEQKRLGCEEIKTSAKYCPVITVGGSYPGFLSAMMRLNYPDIIDIAYASSAPLKLYEHTSDFDSNGYYDFVTKVSISFFNYIALDCDQG